MPIPLVIAPSFKRRLKRKTPEMVGAILECIDRLADNPHHPGLEAHLIHGHKGVWEAYIDGANRVSFHYEAGQIVLRNHCTHDLPRRRP